MKKYLVLLGIVCSLTVKAQSSEDSVKSKISIGVEADVLPYITGGYYGSAWVSYNHWRYRAVVTNVTTPAFMIKDGFTNNKMMVYTLLVDYFFKPSVEKWWIGGGVEYWNAQIQSDLKLSTSGYDNYVATIGGGYVWKFYNNLYLNPWAALHARIGGDKTVLIDGKEFKPAAFIPEASLKIGWYFNVKKR